eukprot:TRINITY_DN11663_c0_g1_i8.p2 TRINITY_DN11663_c0_g1~~TRINITY_DN11663_c0_g1_i8.p2  ORF type:complete len:316 (+),score=85.40 TRINITY_DN11663_c0_g1_i8:1119-2066(+)
MLPIVPWIIVGIPQEDVKSQLIDPDNINSLFTFHTKILGVDHCNYLLQTLRWNPLAKSLKYCESVPHPSFIKQLFQNLPILLSLQSLQLSRTQLDQVYPQFLAALKASKTLTEVDLSASNFSPKEVENLFSVLLENRSIISLNISFNNQIAKTLEKVLPLYLLNKDFVLQKLFAIGISFQNNVLVDIISALVHNKNLKNLELDGLNDDALKSNRDVILGARSHSGSSPGGGSLLLFPKPLPPNKTLCNLSTLLLPTANLPSIPPLSQDLKTKLKTSCTKDRQQRWHYPLHCAGCTQQIPGSTSKPTTSSVKTPAS